MPELTGLVEDYVIQKGDRCFFRTTDGELLEMRGYGSGPSLDLDPRIDLCQPIYEQAERLLAEDARREVEHSNEAA